MTHSRHPLLSFGIVYRRYRKPFWVIHSGWALLSGGVVIAAARERYAFAPWVITFLGLTWLSTMVFARLGEETGGALSARSLGLGFLYYLRRVMYQETLFFLIPFYLYSATPRSCNFPFVICLGVLAVLACLDLVFDRALRRWPAFALAFFAVVAFAALNFLLPLSGRVPLEAARPLAAALGFLSAVPIAFAGREVLQPRRAIVLSISFVLVMLTAVKLPNLIPPIPMRLIRPTFAAGIDRATLEVRRPVGTKTNLDVLDAGAIVFAARVFSPTALETHLTVQWFFNGQPLRRSREITVVAHRSGFRIWDSTRRLSWRVIPGLYRVEVVTSDAQLVGAATLQVVSAPRSGRKALARDPVHLLSRGHDAAAQRVLTPATTRQGHPRRLLCDPLPRRPGYAPARWFPDPAAPLAARSSSIRSIWIS